MQTEDKQALRHRLQLLIDSKTKPQGALGRLEELALQVGLVQGTLRPQINNPHIVVFAGDHGIAATGTVNPYPQAVTAQMVLNFIMGGAAINVFCRQHSLGLVVVDAGVNFDFDPSLIAKETVTGQSTAGEVTADGRINSRLVSRKIAMGTRNYLDEDAMSVEEARRAVEAGKEVVDDLFKQGCNCVGFGEMGIGNTSSASLIMNYITGVPVEECVGRGTGVNDEQLLKKKEVLRAASQRHLPAIMADPGAMTILQHVGGFEVAMMMGAYLQAARRKMVILVDGFITTAALLLANMLDRQVRECCIFSHTSGESGHVKMLEWLDARPLLNLQMRLGEGTGAAMAYPLVQSAVHFLREMASFESAGVSKNEL